MQKLLNMPDAWQPWIERKASEFRLSNAKTLLRLIEQGIQAPSPPEPPPVGIDWPSERVAAPNQTSCDACVAGRHCDHEGVVIRDVLTKASKQIAIEWMCMCAGCAAVPVVEVKQHGM